MCVTIQFTHVCGFQTVYPIYVSQLDEAKQADLLKFPSQNLVIKHDSPAIAHMSILYHKSFTHTSQELTPTQHGAYSLYPAACYFGESQELHHPRKKECKSDMDNDDHA